MCSVLASAHQECAWWATGLEEVLLCSWALLPSPWWSRHSLGPLHCAMVTRCDLGPRSPLHLLSLQPSTSLAP